MPGKTVTNERDDQMFWWRYLLRIRLDVVFPCRALLVNIDCCLFCSCEEQTVKGEGAERCRMTGFTIFGPPVRRTCSPSPLLELSTATCWSAAWQREKTNTLKLHTGANPFCRLSQSPVLKNKLRYGSWFFSKQILRNVYFLMKSSLLYKSKPVPNKKKANSWIYFSSRLSLHQGR